MCLSFHGKCPHKKYIILEGKEQILFWGFCQDLVNPALIDDVGDIYGLNEFSMGRAFYVEKFYDNTFVFCNLYCG